MPLADHTYLSLLKIKILANDAKRSKRNETPSEAIN